MIDRKESVGIVTEMHSTLNANVGGFHSFQREKFENWALIEFDLELRTRNVSNFGYLFSISRCIPWISILHNIQASLGTILFILDDILSPVA
jgi:hypothetical protein